MMPRLRSWLAWSLSLAFASATTSLVRDAAACGGCFGPHGPGTQVTAHRMAFAASPTRTILWDQIQYSGAPSSFAWVLPIRDRVDVGVSTAAFLQALDDATRPVITAPPQPDCSPQRLCQVDHVGSGGVIATKIRGGVDVWSSNVVGPYETTQLSSTDATALQTWLTEHGYEIPPAMVPVIDAYVAEGFGFLAIKLVPNVGVDAMVPVRIAFDGSSVALPLRMIAAGVGAFVGIDLFVLGDGRWEVANFPNAEIPTADLVWDFEAKRSNFLVLERSAFVSAPTAWITETSDAIDLATTSASDDDAAELGLAFPGRDRLTATRLVSFLPSSALSSDLSLRASMGAAIPATREAPGATNACPAATYDNCHPVTQMCGASGSSTADAPPVPLALSLACLAFVARRRRLTSARAASRRG
jgi:hypothetical protein